MRRARSAERMQLGASMADRRHWWPAVARAAAAAGERPAALKARTSSRQRCAVASPVGSGARKCVEAKSTSRSARPAVAGANSAGTAQPCRPDMARKLALQSTPPMLFGALLPRFFWSMRSDGVLHGHAGVGAAPARVRYGGGAMHRLEQ